MALGLKNFTKYDYMKNVLKKTNHAAAAVTISYNKHTSVSGYFLKVNNNRSDELKKKTLYVSAVKSYPLAPSLPLPDNMTQIFGNETARFTQERSRDITGPVLHCQSKITTSSSSILNSSIPYYPDKNGDSEIIHCKDSHTESYDCMGAVSLNSSMQSNVPEPFSSDGKSMHLNMPGGQWSRDDKYIAEDMQNSHYSKTDIKFIDIKDRGEGNVDIINGFWFKKKNNNYHIFNKNKNNRKIYRNDIVMRYTTKADERDTRTKTTISSSSSSSSSSLNKESKNIEDDNSKIDKLSSAQKLKRAIKDYGSTVIVFHVGLSLTSLGISYLVISSGIDVPNLINSLGFFDDEKMKNILSNSSTFVIAYAVHKLFAPFRISITLATTPFLVRYLRKVGILKIK